MLAFTLMRQGPVDICEFESKPGLRPQSKTSRAVNRGRLKKKKKIAGLRWPVNTHSDRSLGGAMQQVRSDYPPFQNNVSKH